MTAAPSHAGLLLGAVPPNAELSQTLLVERRDIARADLLPALAWASVCARRAHAEIFPERVGQWLSGPFAKTARITERPFAHYVRDSMVNNLTGAHVMSFPDRFGGGFTVAVLAPMSRDELPYLARRARLDRFRAEEPVLSPVSDAGPLVVLDASLGMSTGKACAQAAHAAMMLDLAGQLDVAPTVVEVGHDDFTSLVASFPDGHLVADNGRTEVKPGTRTALGLRGH